MKELKTNTEITEALSKDLSVIIAKTRDCSVCKPVSQRLELLMQNYPDIPLYHIYVDDLEEFRGQHLVFTVPTILIFEQGKEILRESRFVDFSRIERLLSVYTS